MVLLAKSSPKVRLFVIDDLPKRCPFQLFRSVSWWLVVVILSGGCQEKADQGEANSKETQGGVIALSAGAEGLSIEQLLDPKTCQACHPTHYAEWRASVHASAAEDPVFRALNRLGQEETQGELGSFCVQCHAPVALALGETEDGLNLNEVPERSQGVTCAFCHQIESVQGTHNNPLLWANDGLMRGGVIKPKSNSAHRSTYSPLLDGRQRESSSLCGSCHDIVTPTDVHLERTFWEWSQSIYASEESSQQSTCGDCHLPSRRVSQSTNTEQRELSASGEVYHDHLMPAVDLTHNPAHGEPLIALNGRTLRAEVENELNITLLSEICGEVGVSGGGEFELYLENVSAGHRFPSGAALDRRLWVEVTAYDSAGEELFASGRVAPGQPAVEAQNDDETMWLFRDTAYDVAGEETHLFWNISSVNRLTLPPSKPLWLPSTPSDEESHVLKRYRFGTERPIYELRLRVFLRPIGLELLNQLVDKGYLAAEIIEEMPTFELSAAGRSWRVDETEPRATLSGRELLCTPL